MNHGRFDERCPHCNAKIANLNDVFIDHDYQSNFRFDCVRCGKEIECDVHSVPEFELSKAQTPDEYKAMVARLKDQRDA